MNRKPLFLVLIAAIFWGLYPSFVTYLSREGITDGLLIFTRLLVVVLSMIVIIAVKDRSMFRIRLRDLPLFLANGFISIVFFFSCYSAAIRVTKIAVAASLLYTAPAIVLIISAFVFKEHVTAKKVFCIALSIAGCALVSGMASGGLSISVTGLLLGLGAGLGYGLYSIFSTLILNRGYSSYTNIFYSFLIAFIFYSIQIIVSGEFSLLAARPAAAAVCLLNGFITGTCSYTFYTNGLRQMEPSRAAQIATVEPAAAALFGVLLFHQMLSGMEILGVALVVFSVIMMNSSGRKPA